MSDSCACGPKKAIVLSVSLSRDELPCGHCGKAIAVDDVKAARDTMHLLRRWVDQAYAIEMLWFSSADYEDWSKHELENPKSKINQLGLQLAKKMNSAIETWLYYAPKAAAKQYVDKYLHHCPFCFDPTDPSGLIPKFGLGCAECRVAGSSE